ncbi:MAG: hypothetical protein ABS35_38975 [Kaistia sp. SCN 65-12]|nr:MAG: hypothetical protein ABS35_38975 [Kaistia sp. SCN 65-12]
MTAACWAGDGQSGSANAGQGARRRQRGYVKPDPDAGGRQAADLPDDLADRQHEDMGQVDGVGGVAENKQQPRPEKRSAPLFDHGGPEDDHGRRQAVEKGRMIPGAEQGKG